MNQTVADSRKKQKAKRERIDEIERDLDKTEVFYKNHRNPIILECINKLRLVLIIEAHHLKYSSSSEEF